MTSEMLASSSSKMEGLRGGSGRPSSDPQTTMRRSEHKRLEKEMDGHCTTKMLAMRIRASRKNATSAPRSLSVCILRQATPNQSWRLARFSLRASARLQEQRRLLLKGNYHDHHGPRLRYMLLAALWLSTPSWKEIQATRPCCMTVSNPLAVDMLCRDIRECFGCI
jgi:hypothetical protein